jgi:beta-phosphoglucomutase-like phosphatase (HAD superfamily)
VVIDTGLCRAVIFDMDGVVSDSVPAYRQAWQKTFDAFLDESGSDAPRFEEADYLTYVDGKPRYDGVRDFLGSRGIDAFRFR